MKKPSALFYNILIFVIAQIAWFSLLGLWIYWYVNNYLLFNKVSDIPVTQTTNIVALVSGLTLLVLLSLSMSLIFIYLNRQLHLTRQYDAFISNVTHELKSPLSSIQLYLETMLKRKLSDTHRQEFIELMLKDIDRLNHLITSILYLSGLEQDKMARKISHDYHIYDADFIIKEVIMDAVEYFKLPAGSVTISGSAPCQCVVDRNWLKIVFDNLMDNAIKYSPVPVQIHIHLSCGIRYFTIDFSDKGVGIPAKDQKKVFLKFQRIQNPDSPSVKGTGLGLYWVKQIIRQHGGHISVHSGGPNQGTSFKINLPIYQAAKNWYINRLLRISRKSRAERETGNEQEPPDPSRGR